MVLSSEKGTQNQGEQEHEGFVSGFESVIAGGFGTSRAGFDRNRWQVGTVEGEVQV